MGWMSGQKSVYKLNTLRIGKGVQEEFLRNHLRLNKKQVVDLKQKTGGAILQTGKMLTASQFQKTLGTHNPNIASKWQEFLKQKDKEYEAYQVEEKQENIKKIRQMDRKKEVADKMIHQLTGRNNSEKLCDKFKHSITIGRADLKYQDLTRAEKQALIMKEKNINLKNTESHHAETSKVSTVHEARKAEELRKSKVRDKGNTWEIEEAQEQGKTLPELPI
jgi:hypothetical protein